MLFHNIEELRLFFKKTVSHSGMAAFALCSYLILGVGSLVTRTPVCLFFGQGYLATFVPKKGSLFSSSRKKWWFQKWMIPFFLKNPSSFSSSRYISFVVQQKWWLHFFSETPIQIIQGVLTNESQLRPTFWPKKSRPNLVGGSRLAPPRTSTWRPPWRTTWWDSCGKPNGKWWV